MLKTSATLEVDKLQGTMVKIIISPLSSVIASFSLISSTNCQQFKQSVFCPSVGSSSAIPTALLKTFVTLLFFLFPVWRVLSGLTFFRGEQSNSSKDLSTRLCAVSTEISSFFSFSPISASFSIVIVEAATLWAHLHETWSGLKSVWNLKLIWKVVPFTWQFHCEQPWKLKPLSKIVLFTWRFHCSNFPN